MQRGGLENLPGIRQFREHRERTRDIYSYQMLIKEAVERRKQEGRDDADLSCISQLSTLSAIGGGQFMGGPEGVANFMWKNALGSYLDAARKYDIDLFALEKPNWLKEANTNRKDWLTKSPADRYIAIETDRAAALAKQWKPDLDAIKEGAHCLDIGCGSGFFVRHMQKQYPKLHWQATDLARDMPINGGDLDRAKTDWFKPCEIDKPLPYADASQDVVTLNNVLHHVATEKIKPFLQEVQRVLKPGGTLLVTEEFADMECEVVNGQLRGKTAAVHVPKYVDKVFWKNDPGNQHPVHQWQTIIANGARFNFEQGKDGCRVVGTFGTPGLPVLEACMRFTCVGDTDWWTHGGGPYL